MYFSPTVNNGLINAKKGKWNFSNILSRNIIFFHFCAFVSQNKDDFVIKINEKLY